MTLEQAILDAVRELPADKQRDLLDHVKRLRDEAMQPQKPRKNGRGLWADLNIDLSASTSHQGLGDAIGRHPRSRAVVLWVRLPSQTPWPAGQTGKGASLRLKRFSRFDSGAGHQVMPAYENRSIGGAQTSVFVGSNSTAGSMRA